MVTATGYAYPWDITDDPASLDRARAMGLDAIAVAAAYHTTRIPTPLHPTRRLVTVPHAACYVPVRPEVWRGRALVPRLASWLAEENPYASANTAIRSVGLGSVAWIVLTHSSVLGSSVPDLVARNAFGERYEYALCPRNEEVAEYCATLVGEVVALGEPDGVILEACGRLGLDHGGHHDKVDFAQWTAVQKQLMSLCFCAACERAYAAVGIGDLASLVRAAVGSGIPPASLVDALGAELTEAVRKILIETAVSVRERVVASARVERPDLRVSMHGAVDPFATGPFSPLGEPSGVDGVVTSCWVGGDAAVARIAEMSAYVGDGVAVGGYFRPDTVRPADGPPVEEYARRFVAAGLDELHLYHLGMLPQHALDFYGELISAARS